MNEWMSSGYRWPRRLLRASRVRQHRQHVWGELNAQFLIEFRFLKKNHCIANHLCLDTNCNKCFEWLYDFNILDESPRPHCFTSLKSWNDRSSTANRKPWGCGISMLYAGCRESIACSKYCNRFLPFLTHYYWISTVQCVTVKFFLAAQILDFFLVFVLFSSFSLEGEKNAHSLNDSQS